MPLPPSQYLPQVAPEAAVVTGLSVYPVQNLREAVSFLEGEHNILPTKVDLADIFRSVSVDEIDFAYSLFWLIGDVLMLFYLAQCGANIVF